MNGSAVFTGLVDFHCHLDLYPDHSAAIACAERDRVYTLAVTTTPKAWPRNRDLAARTRYVRAALGLHPQLVTERASELRLWEEYLPQARYVGEVGLDAGPQFYHSFELQKRIFEHILGSCARAGDKILTVHSVRAVTSVLDLVEAKLPSRGKVVLHWFTGSRLEARRAVDLGCYFSINADMLLTERSRYLVAAIPLDRLLTETDGPFTQIKGRATQPADVAVVIEALGRARKTTSADIAAAVRANLRRLLNFTSASEESFPLPD